MWRLKESRASSYGCNAEFTHNYKTQPVVFTMINRTNQVGTAFRSTGLLAAALAVLAALALPSQAADIFKADNLNALNQPASWDGAIAPTSADIAVWDNRVATAIPQNINLGADTNWSGIRILDPGSPVTIGIGNTLTLGAGGIDTSSASQSLTLSNALVAGAPQTWNVVAALGVRNGVGGTSLVTKTGGGTLTIANVSPTLTKIQIDQGIVSSSVGGVGSTIMSLNGGTFSVNAALSTPVEVIAGGGILQNTGGNRTLSGSISGNGPLTVNAASTFTWSASNSFSGTATIQGSGAVRLSNLSAVSSNATYIVNAAMNANAAGTFHLGSFSGNGFLGGGAGQNFSIGALNTDTVFSGVISSAGFITKVGTGTLTLDGANTYAGATIISNGTLQIGSGSVTGKFGTGSVTNNSRLVFNRDGVLTTPNLITGSGSVSNVGPGKVELTGANTYTGPTVITAGRLTFGSASLAPGNVTVGDSAGVGALVTSSGATLTQGNLSFGSSCSYEFDLGTFGNHPGTVATNTGTVTLNGNVTVNLAGTNFSNGTITLLRYANRAGVGSFVLGTLPANVNLVSFNDDTVNKRVTLTLSTGVIVDNTFKWLGGAAGDWDIDNLANQIWQVVGTAQTTNYTEGAAVLFNDTATGTTNINLTTFVSPSAVTVNNTNKIFTLGGIGSVSGATGLTKKGPGALIVTNANSYSGLTAIEAGSIRVAGETGTLGSGGVTNNGALILDRTEATNALPNTLLFSGQITGTGSLTVLGVDNTNSTVQVEVGVASGNPYSGGTTISNAFVRLNANPVSDATRGAAKSTGLGSGTISFLGNSTLELEDYGVGNNSAQAGNLTAALNVPAGQTGTLRTGGRMTVSGALTGNGTFNLAVSYIRCVIAGDFSAFTGQVNVTPSPNTTGNQYQIGNATGLPLAKVHLATGVTMGGNAPLANNSIVPIGELSGDEGSFIAGVGEAPRNAIFSVGGLNTSSTFAGSILGHSLTKVGTGVLTLSGTNNTFIGATTISNGVLALVTNSLGSNTEISNAPTVTITAPGVLDVSGQSDKTFSLGLGGVNQTLGGNGTIRGSLLVGGLGTVSPGFPIGSLTVTNTVSLSGATLMELNRAGSPNSDRIISPAITAGGTLTVTNIGLGLQAGDTFQLFSTAVSGSFATVNLPATDTVNQLAYTWNNKLAVDGTIVVLTATPTVNTTPTNITTTVTGNTLDLQWPSDRTGWTLQTNSVGVAVANQWYPHPGSTLTNRVIITIDPSKANVFYRLVYP